MSALYLRDDLGVASVSIGDALGIGGAEARHAVTVNRARVGERLTIGNGRGLLATGRVIQAKPDELLIEVEQLTQTPAPTPTVTLVQALAKGDRDELAIQAATELGVDGVIPWAAQRSVTRWVGTKVAKGRERWVSIVREATKQSIRPWLPTVGELVTTAQLAGLPPAGRVLVLDPTASQALSGIKVDGVHPRGLLLVVGPEGGLAPDELAALESAGAERVRLGESILRTSTAGPAALAVLNGILGRW